MYAIEVRNLWKVYGGNVQAVKNVTFTLARGEITGFLGPNGAGKTTTMRIITGYMAPTSGTVHIMGEKVTPFNPSLRQIVGYLPENNPLYTDMTVVDYLLFAGLTAGMSRSLVEKRIPEVVDICGLEGYATRKIEELSRGYRQRVGLAQALLPDPPILILDEPTSGLDPIQTLEVRNLIKQLGKEKTILLSTHILPEAEAICSRIIIIHRGEIVADGSPDELTRSAQVSEIIIMVEGEKENIGGLVDALRSSDGITLTEKRELPDGTFTLSLKCEGDSRKARRELFFLCHKHETPILEMKVSARSLEDVFRELTMKEQNEMA